MMRLKIICGDLGAGEAVKDDSDRNTQAVKALFKSVGKHGNTPVLSETTRFFILGLAPNAARISGLAFGIWRQY